MLHLVVAELFPETRKNAYKRYLTGEGQMPEGAKITVQVVSLDGRSFTLVDTDDIVALGKWVEDWSDYFTFEVIPVTTAEQFAQIISP